MAVRRQSPKGFENAIEHPRIVIRDLAVGETQNLKSLTSQPCIAFGVAGRVVEGAIGFHNQPVAKAEEVNDIGPEWDLSTEFEPLQSPATQQRPQEPLGVGL